MVVRGRSPKQPWDPDAHYLKWVCVQLQGLFKFGKRGSFSWLVDTFHTSYIIHPRPGLQTCWIQTKPPGLKCQFGPVFQISLAVTKYRPDSSCFAPCAANCTMQRASETLPNQHAYISPLGCRDVKHGGKLISGF